MTTELTAPTTNQTYTLRKYQQDAANAGVAFLKSNKTGHGLIVAPTGCGKSLIISEIANQLNEPLIIFQPSREVLLQNAEKLDSYGILDYSIFSASLGQKKINRITLATIGSAINKPELFKQFKFSIIDEAHNVGGGSGQYKDFIRQIGLKCIGLTATPYKLGRNSYGNILRFLTRSQPRTFTELLYYIQIQELADQGFFAKTEYFQVKGFDSSKLRVNTTGTGYTDASIKAYYREILFENKLIKAVDRLIEIGRKHILVFTQFVAESETCAKTYGDEAAVLTGETPTKQREEILRKFKSGEIKVIFNCAVLTTGYDFPALDTIVMARPTRSLNLYYQCNGRAVRPHHTKDTAWIVDMCNNYDLFGRIEDMVVAFDDKGLPCIKSGDKQLTNVYF